MSNLEHNYRLVEDQIHAACSRAGRKRDELLLVAVSKNQPISAIAGLYALGLRHFGESRVQELLVKKDELPGDIHWHFIGHLQSNKARQIASFIGTVHSIDSIETARELSKRAGQHGRTIDVLAEVNISGEEQKNGVQPSNAMPFIEMIAVECQNLIPTGLMGMASREENPERTRPQFLLLRSLRYSIVERHPELKTFKELSMGMTNDFEVAIECGATMVRIGSALFGEQNQ
jgi:pyridoxal phosphate enzyme (YggS family)